MNLKQDAEAVIAAALHAAMPDTAVQKALQTLPPCRGRLVLVAVGKAAWQMASAALAVLKGRVDGGIVITKYGHARGALPGLCVREAGHPVPDENSFAATQAAIDLVTPLTGDDLVLFLLSGGGSALFEKPLIDGGELAALTKQLLASGADIVEINTIRKRLSAVKGGRFAALCAPARVFSVVLSDIIGDPLDMIASGPAYPDGSTTEQALYIVEKYGLALSAEAMALLRAETPKSLPHVETHVTGSVRQLCAAAETSCRELGYRPTVLTASLCCEAREAGRFLPPSPPITSSRGNPSRSLPAEKRSCMCAARGLAAAIRSLPCPPRRALRAWRIRRCSRSVPTVRTARRTRRAAMWTGGRARRLKRRGAASRTHSTITTPIMRCARWTACS